MSIQNPADPWAGGNYGPRAEPLPPDLAGSLVSWTAAQAAAEPVPYTLTGQAEAALDAAEPKPAEPWKSCFDAAEAAAREAEYEAEWAGEWDSEESNAYQDRAEAGLEPEAEP